MSMDLTDADRSRFQFETSPRRLFLLQKSSREREIRRARDLDVSFGASNDCDGMAHPFDEAGLVGAVILILRSAINGFSQKLDAEDLRRLCQNKVFACEGRFDKITFRLFHRIDDRNPKNSGAGSLALPHDIFDVFNAHEGTHAVMNRDDIRA